MDVHNTCHDIPNIIDSVFGKEVVHQSFGEYVLPPQWELDDRNYLGDGLSYIVNPTYDEQEKWGFRPFYVIRPYVAYKRISHFREHLNRLMYSQFVSISPKCLKLVSDIFEQNKYLANDENVYSKIQHCLYQYGYSKYTEHIHHMISRYTGKSLKIDYDDYGYLCILFRQLEKQFNDNRINIPTRKNFISYQIVLQFLLFIMHIHPHYYLPTIKDAKKRSMYYSTCMVYFAETEEYTAAMTVFITRQRKCKNCLYGNYMFDEELIHSVVFKQ